MSNYMPASFDKRLLAQTIDLTLMVPVVVLLNFLWEVRPTAFWVYYLALYYAFVVPFEISPMQGTPGKTLTGLRVVAEKGGKLPLSTCLFRQLGKWLSFIPVSLGYFIIYFHAERKSFHDLISHSQVVDVTLAPPRKGVDKK